MPLMKIAVCLDGRISIHDHIFTKPLWVLSPFPMYPIPPLPHSCFMLFTPSLFSLSCLILGSLCSPLCLFPPRTCMLILFLFMPTVAHGSHPQLHTFRFSPCPNSPSLQITPVLFTLSHCHQIHHMTWSFSFHVHMICHTSSHPPVSPPFLNPTHNTYSTGIWIPVNNTNILIIVVIQTNSLFTQSQHSPHY